MNVVYVDGACAHNPGGPGGWAIVLVVDGKEQRSWSGSEPTTTTSNRMELVAALKAIEATRGSVTIRSDSKYVVDGMTKWIGGWKRRGWVTKDREPVKNRDLWEAIDAARMGRFVRFEWVRGHAGNAFNEKCNQLAEAQAASLVPMWSSRAVNRHER